MGREGRRSRATTNLTVDAVIGLAFLVTSVTGIVKYLPVDWFGGAGAQPLGLGYPLWTAIHDWSGFVMVAGILLHAAPHRRWIATMVRRVADPGGAQRAAGAGSRRVPATPAIAVDATAQADALRPLPPATKHPAGATAEGRFTRRRFLAGAAVALVAAAVGGAAGRASAGLDAIGATSTSETSAAPDQSAGSSTDTSSGSDTGSATTTVSTRVSVDSSRCEGCGRCLQVCPVGVFATSSDGRYAVAQNPEACRLCGHCVQVCPASAITLSA